MLELSIDAFNDFRCTGSSCEDTCCRGWSIIVDQDTYFKYKKEKTPELQAMFKKNITRLKNVNKNSYAIMNLNNNGECMFLDNDKLCSVYKLLGPDKMCYTCQIYPRQIVEVYNIVQKSIALSCPEACRKVLFREQPLEFNLEEVSLTKENFKNNLTNGNNINHFSKEIFFELRSFAIGLLQNRNYSLEERLLILGMFIEDISSKKDEDILEVINSYNLKINNNTFKNITTYIDKNSILGTKIRQCVNIYLSIVPTFKRNQIIKTMEIIEHGLNLSKNDYNEFKKNYLFIRDNYANEVFKQYHYVFENYLVNYIFKNPKVFLERDLINNYAEMLIYYNMLSFSILGAIGSLKDNVTENDLVLVISTISRGVEHNSTNTNSLKALIDKYNLNSLNKLIPLITA